MARQPKGPTGPPSPEERAETRRAIWLVALCALVAVGVYAVVSGVMTDDAYLSRLGRGKEIHFVQRDIRELDREAALGDAPVTWILGSSITREAFDAESIQARIAEAGSPHRVLKFAFNRGAPLFSKALLDELPVRPGDRVVTSLSEDNFRADWLSESGDFTLYTQSLLTPDEILSLHEESIATRLEWSLASVPPRYYARNRDAFRRGVVKELNYALGVRKRKPPKQNVSYQPFTDTNNSSRSPSTAGWTFAPEELRLEPGQPNFDAMAALRHAVEERGAELIVVYIPSRPLLYESVLDPSIITRFHDHWDAALPEFHRLRPRTARAYMDLKHPNNHGRPGFSAELANVLLAHEGLPTLPLPIDPTLAPVTPANARIQVGVDR